MSINGNELEERKAAVKQVLLVLRNPLMLMSVVDRADAKRLATEFNITAAELIELAENRAKHA